MPWFEYDGLTSGNAAIRGKIEAVDNDSAVRQLANMRIDLRQIRPAESTDKKTPSLSHHDLVFFNEQLAALAKAGIALDQGLGQLARDVKSPRVKKWIIALVEDIKNGTPLDQAIAKHEQGLPLLYSNVVRTGMKTGDLHGALLNLNQHLSLVGKTRRIFWEAASYPIAVGFLALGIISIYFMYIAPQFMDIFLEMDLDKPTSVSVVEHVSNVYPFALATLLFVFGLCALIWRGLKWSRAGLHLRERVSLSIPVLGSLYHTSLIARFLRSVSTAMNSGSDLPNSIQLAADATGSYLLSRDAQALIESIECGKSMIEANQKSTIIPPIFGFCIQTAVGRNDVPESVRTLSESYETKAAHGLSLLQTVLFPAFILFIGVFLALCIGCTMKPISAFLSSMSGG